MKLYATVTSERATKGQGGNKFLDIALQIEIESKRYHYGTITLNDQYALSFTDNGGAIKLIYTASRMLEADSKGKQQKGEIDCGCEKNVFACRNHK